MAPTDAGAAVDDVGIVPVPPRFVEPIRPTPKFVAYPPCPLVSGDLLTLRF